MLAGSAPAALLVLGGGGWLQVLCYVLAHFVEVSVQHKMGGSGTLAAGAVSAEAIAQSG